MAPAAVYVPYFPSESDAEHFWSANVHHATSTVDRPFGFPEKIKSPLAWTGQDVERKPASWTLQLTESEIVSIDDAVGRYQDEHGELSSISAETFKIPTELSNRLKQVSSQVYDGTGFQVIRGLDPSKHTTRENIIAYAGIAAHIFPQRGFVDPFGGVVTHIVNRQGEDPNPPSAAPAFGRTPLSFHTDNCEIMGFYYLDTALTGGRTLLASSWQTYNELAALRPEVLHTLAEPWWMDTFKSYETHPARHWRLLQKLPGGKVLLRFSRYGITGWQRPRNANLPRPTQAQIDAIDAVQFIAMKNAFALPSLKGDLVFVNDLALMHGRESFDEGGVYLRRHILKMFFRDPEKTWDLPPSVWEESMCKYSSNSGLLESWCIEPKKPDDDKTYDNG